MDLDDEDGLIQSAVKALASIDPTTGLLNAHGWIAYAKRHLKRAVHSQQRLGLVFLRVQNFARLRADLGDETVEGGMHQVAEALQFLVRPGDLLGRWRADDFIVLLPYVDGGAIEMIAERLAYGVRRKPILVGNRVLPLTILTGGASLVVTYGELHELDTLLAEAERRLVASAVH
jgi:diguanylate cyclase (GGDEF)-like protein